MNQIRYHARFRSLVSLLFLASVASANAPQAHSQTGGRSGIDLEGEDQYATCITLAEKAPDRGINLALEWQLRGGGVPARHCEAVGLFFAGEYAESAVRLEGIAEDMRIGRGMPLRGDTRATATAAMLADTYRQAANAWLRGRELVRAEAAIGQALALVPENTVLELSIREDRAHIAAAEQDYTLALSELEAVLRAQPKRTDILLFIASAARALEHYDRADVALAGYLRVVPDDPAAYLELGNLRDAQGNRPEARKAWLKAIALNEAGADAVAARANLERIDVAK